MNPHQQEVEVAETEKTTFPMLPVKHWWALRDRFKTSIPGVVSPNYVASTLNMQEQSARANVILPLRMLGIIDEESRTNQDLAIAWRDDERYAEVCAEIQQRVYPRELIEAVPDPVADRDAAERWFANATGTGTPAVRRMAALYAVISQPDLASRNARKTKPGRSGRRDESSGKARSVKKAKKMAQLDSQGADDERPGIAINLQIHISSDATPDQIDAIFESMAKHIYKKR